MTYFLRTEADLQLGLAQLILADPRLKPVADKAGTFALRRREPGFSRTLCNRMRTTAIDRECGRNSRSAVCSI